jgi:hypothetical protein
VSFETARQPGEDFGTPCARSRPANHLIFAEPCLQALSNANGRRGKSRRKRQDKNMKRTIAALVGTLIVGAALTLPAVSFAQTPHGLHRQRENNFPGMHDAIHQLESTREYLKRNTAHDFHGHKTNAINHINEAIKELRLGIQSDLKH